MFDQQTKKEWLRYLKIQLIATLPKGVVVDYNHGVSATRTVEFIKKRWVVRYSYSACGREEDYMRVKSRSLFKAVWKAHKKILSLCVDTSPF